MRPSAPSSRPVSPRPAEPDPDRYLEFRWYADGELRMRPAGRAGAADKLNAERGGGGAVGSCGRNSLAHRPASTASSREARRTYGPAGAPDPRHFAASSRETRPPLFCAAGGSLRQDTHRRPGSAGEQGEFAAMLAQTLAYGLFAARVMETSTCSPSRGADTYPQDVPVPARLIDQVTGP